MSIAADDAFWRAFPPMPESWLAMASVPALSMMIDAQAGTWRMMVKIARHRKH